MKLLRLVALGTALVVGSCDARHPITPNVSKVFQGHYTKRFEIDSFRPCGQDEDWWVKHETDALIRAVTNANGMVGGELYVEVEGTVSDRGSYGHLGAYDREIRVSKVLRTEAPRKTCE